MIVPSSLFAIYKGVKVRGLHCGERGGCKPRSSGVDGAVEGKSVVEPSGLVLEDFEPRFDQRPIFQRFMLVLAV